VKFTHGQWLLREGVTAAYPFRAHEVSASRQRLEVLAPTFQVRDRGDTLKGPVATLELTSPMTDVVAVTLTHFAGGRVPHPAFDLAGGYEPDVAVAVDDEAASFTSGALTVRVHRGEEWRVDFLGDGRLLTSSGPKDMGFLTTGDGAHHVREQLELGVGDAVYGLGERFGPLVRNGQAVDVWNADGGTSSELAYKNVPFFLTNAGYGVFVDHPGLVSFEVGSEMVSRVQFSVQDQSLRYLMVYGPTPKEILRKYTELTGRPALPPPWSFGLWLSTSFTTSYDEETVTSFIDGMAERDIPLSVFHFDCFWMRELHWCDFEWDPEVFPDPPGMLRRLKDRGLRICVWINPYISQHSRLFREGQDRGFLLRRPNGDVWQWDLWQPGMALVDFTNPEAREWFADHLDALLDMGVDCFKTDFGERVPTDVAWFDGSDPERMHNHYTYLYNRTVFELLTKRRGEGEAVVFARSATAGSQRFPVHWSGDCESTFPAMAGDLRGGLSLGMSGFGFWSHDIGGFEGTPDPALFKRWLAFGLLSSHSRLHGNSSYRVPWLFDEEAVEVTRLFTRLKARLMPYLFQAARQARDEGIPVMRAMVVEFPEDPACATLDRQYMLGDDLLVAPVLRADGRVDYYVPPGEWTHLLTGEVVSGPRWVSEEHGFDSLPLLARPGSVVALGVVDDRPDYAYAEGVTLRAHRLPDGVEVVTVVPDQAGATAATFRTTRRGRVVTVETDATGGWQLLLVGERVAAVDGGDATDHEHGVLTRARGARLRVTLDDA
jgi:alpha-D-xyloside xylohydrolase